VISTWLSGLDRMAKYRAIRRCVFSALPTASRMLSRSRVDLANRVEAGHHENVAGLSSVRFAFAFSARAWVTSSALLAGNL
jgi:hypothetical protein